jgi:formate/nitrite transporter FocA (FNT family)
VKRRAASIGFGTADFHAQAFGPAGACADVGWFLLWATPGNIVGGVVFVAFLKYGHARPPAQTAAE